MIKRFPNPSGLDLIAIILAVSVGMQLSKGEELVKLTKDDYQRAEYFGSGKVSRLIQNSRVDITWLNEGNGFWFRSITAGKKTFYRVDPDSGKRPAFDHKQLATALAEVMGKTINPTMLPFGPFTQGRPFVGTWRA